MRPGNFFKSKNYRQGLLVVQVKALQPKAGGVHPWSETKSLYATGRQKIKLQ